MKSYKKKQLCMWQRSSLPGEKLMVRKILSLILVALLCLGFAAPAFATGDSTGDSTGDEEILPEIFYDKSIKSTEQFLVKITRPEGDESTIYKTYLICGSALQDGLTIQLLVENKDGVFEKYVLNDESGESSWSVNAYSYFQKEVALKEGANRIRVVVYKTAEIEEPKLSVNLQLNDFTVTLLPQNLIDYLNRGLILKLGDLLRSLFIR